MGQGADVVGNRSRNRNRNRDQRARRETENAISQRTADSGDTTAIRGDIERTRAELSDTIDALQERLDPQVVTQQVKDKVRGQAQAKVAQATQNMREGVRMRVRQVQSVAQDTLAAAQAKVRHATGVSGQPSQLGPGAGGLSATLANYASLAQLQARRAIDRVRVFSDEEPGAFAAVMAIAGIGLVGLFWIARSADD